MRASLATHTPTHAHGLISSFHVPVSAGQPKSAASGMCIWEEIRLDPIGFRAGSPGEDTFLRFFPADNILDRGYR